MRRREHLAWAILIASCAIFLGVLAAGVLGAGWYREQAVSMRYATLDILRDGTVLYQSEESVRETTATRGMRLQDGDRIRTPADGQALISFPDGSNAQLWPNSEVQVRQLRSSTYNDHRNFVLLSQLSGHARYNVAPSLSQERRFEVQTPQGRTLLREGSYRVDVTALGTELAVRTGSASVAAREQTVEVIRGERTIVGPNARPSPPAEATRNLIVNGDFLGGFARWQQGPRKEEDGVSGRVFLEQSDGRYFVRMRRQGSQKHGETFIQQQINLDVTDETSLRLIMDIKVGSHTLSGGGVLGSEYPLLVRLKYRDAYGSEADLVRGFYLRNPDARPTTNGVQVAPDQWLPVTLDLFDEKTIAPRPAHLLWVEVESAGWEFEAFVTGIQLLAA